MASLEYRPPSAVFSIAVESTRLPKVDTNNVVSSDMDDYRTYFFTPGTPNSRSASSVRLARLLSTLAQSDMLFRTSCAAVSVTPMLQPPAALYCPLFVFRTSHTASSHGDSRRSHFCRRSTRSLAQKLPSQAISNRMQVARRSESRAFSSAVDLFHSWICDKSQTLEITF